MRLWKILTVFLSRPCLNIVTSYFLVTRPDLESSFEMDEKDVEPQDNDNPWLLHPAFGCCCIGVLVA